VIGREPSGRMRMLEYAAGEGCPVWMTHWCVEGGAWALFPPADAAGLIPPEDRPEPKPVPTLFGG